MSRWPYVTVDIALNENQYVTLIVNAKQLLAALIDVWDRTSRKKVIYLGSQLQRRQSVTTGRAEQSRAVHILTSVNMERDEKHGVRRVRCVCVWGGGMCACQLFSFPPLVLYVPTACGKVPPHSTCREGLLPSLVSSGNVLTQGSACP